MSRGAEGALVALLRIASHTSSIVSCAILLLNKSKRHMNREARDRAHVDNLVAGYTTANDTLT